MHTRFFLQCSIAGSNLRKFIKCDARISRRKAMLLLQRDLTIEYLLQTWLHYFESVFHYNNGCPSLPKMTALCLSWGLSQTGSHVGGQTRSGSAVSWHLLHSTIVFHYTLKNAKFQLVSAICKSNSKNFLAISQKIISHLQLTFNSYVLYKKLNPKLS